MTQNKNTYVCFTKGDAKVKLFSCTNIMHLNLHNGGGSHIESSWFNNDPELFSSAQGFVTFSLKLQLG